MPSPVRPSDFAATVPGQSADFCTKFKLVLITLPNLINQFFGWALGSDGSVSDSFKAEVNPFSSGDLKWTVSSTIASGWLRCEGQAVSRTTYAALFNSISTRFGTGDGSTTFNVPDYRDRVLLGVSATKALATTGGEATHLLSINELPDHGHNIAFGTNQANYTANGPVVVGIGGGASLAGVTHTGGNAAHNNLPPYAAAYCFIKI